jgi:hypothetical protein
MVRIRRVFQQLHAQSRDCIRDVPVLLPRNQIRLKIRDFADPWFGRLS